MELSTSQLDNRNFWQAYRGASVLIPLTQRLVIAMQLFKTSYVCLGTTFKVVSIS